MGKRKTITLNEAAERYGVSRQRIHKWLKDKGKIAECERHELRVHRYPMLLIPEDLFQNVPSTWKEPTTT